MDQIPRVTRGKLLKILRDLDDFRDKSPNGNFALEITTPQFIDQEGEPKLVDVRVKLRAPYANYEYLTREIYGGPKIRQGGFESDAPSGLIRDEILRMTNDGLVIVGKQWASFYWIQENGEEELFDPEGWFVEEDIEDYKTQIILTTKGKSIFEYWKSNFPENATAWFALFVSVIALLVSIFR
jgi:hypothetical protein